VPLEAGVEDSSCGKEKKTENEDFGDDQNQKKGKEYFGIDPDRFHGVSTNM
jgi:hypothetical protein